MALSVLRHAAAPKPLRILLADDGERLRTAIRGMLQAFGRYDEVFLDVHMPALGG